jgi:hypothetical protein
MLGASQRFMRADAFAEGFDRRIAGQHQMVAIVDGQPQRGVEIAAAAPPARAADR